MDDAFEQMTKTDPKELFPEGTNVERVSKETKEPIIEKKEEPIIEEKEPEVMVDEHLKFINEKTGFQFKDYDEIKTHIEKSSKVDELNQKMTDFEQKQTQLKEQEEIISKFNDPSKYFADESEMKRQQLLIKYGKEMNRDVLGQITSDLSNVSDFKLASMALQLENPKLTSKQAEALICKNVEGDPDEEPEKWNEIALAGLNVLANKARKQFKEITESVKLPDKFDPVAFKKQREDEMAQRNELLTSSWSPILTKGAELAKGVKIPGKNDKNEDVVKFEYAYSDEFKKSIPEKAKELILEYGLDKTKENYESVMATLENRFILENLPKMFDAFEKDIVARETKKVYDKKTHPSDDLDKGKTGEEHNDESDQSEKAFNFLTGGRKV
jgi:hypothetical protein